MENKVLKRKLLGNKRFNWKQKEFILSTFNCIGEDVDLAIKNCVEAGFNLLEVGWGRHDKVWETVEACEKYKIDLIFQDLSLFGGMMNRHDNRSVSDETIRETAKKLKAKKHTIGFYVWDEPYCTYLFEEARRQSDVLLECSPNALMFSVFPPSYNPGPTWENGKYYDSFDEYIRILEPPVVSMDYYPVGDYWNLYPNHKYDDEYQLDNSPIWIDIAVARDLAKKYNLPFWFYYQGCKVYDTEKFEFPMVRSMMNIGALYGAKGLQHYTATGVDILPNDNNTYPTEKTVLIATGEKGEFFEEQKKIHAEFKNLGNTLMALNNEAVYHSSDVAPYGKYNDIYKQFEDRVEESELLEGTLPIRTSVGEFCDDYANKYLFVLNRDFYKPLEEEIRLKNAYNIYEVSKEDGKQYLIEKNTDNIRVCLDCGDSILLRVQSANEEPCTIEYVLD